MVLTKPYAISIYGYMDMEYGDMENGVWSHGAYHARIISAI
jgi:hypothetical protein